MLFLLTAIMGRGEENSDHIVLKYTKDVRHNRNRTSVFHPGVAFIFEHEI